MLRPIALSLLAGLLALPGCGRHHQVVRPAPPTAEPAAEPAANDEKPAQRVINGESETVKNWSTGGP